MQLRSVAKRFPIITYDNENCWHDMSLHLLINKRFDVALYNLISNRRGNETFDIRWDMWAIWPPVNTSLLLPTLMLQLKKGNLELIATSKFSNVGIYHLFFLTIKLFITPFGIKDEMYHLDIFYVVKRFDMQYAYLRLA